MNITIEVLQSYQNIVIVVFQTVFPFSLWGRKRGMDNYNVSDLVLVRTRLWMGANT